MSTYTRWYRDGSVSLTKNSNAVVGVNTYWLTAGLNPGDIFKVDGVDYEIVSITDNTHLTLAGNYAGTTGSDKAYAIVRNFTATTQARMAAQTSELLGDFAKYIDNDMQSIHGKSAYQIACEKGYVGTESEWVASLKGDNAYQVAVAAGYTGTREQWLESLKAAGEWSTLDARTEMLAYKYDSNIGMADIHNAFNRCKKLGAFTAEHSAAIRANTFDDIYSGDVFVQRVPAYEWTDHEGTVHQEAAATISARVLGCNSFSWMLRYMNVGEFQPHVVAWVYPPIQAPMNSSGGTAGGYVGSEIFTQVLLKAEALLKAAFGEDHILPHKDLLCNSVTDGKETGWAWYTDRKCDLLSEVMVTGKNIYSEPIKILDSWDIPYIGQQPFFANRLTPIHLGSYVWLRDAADGTHFTMLNPAGGVTSWNASDARPAWSQVRPFFLLY